METICSVGSGFLQPTPFDLETEIRVILFFFLYNTRDRGDIQQCVKKTLEMGHNGVVALQI